MHFTTSLLLLAATTQAHYHYSRLVINGKQDATDFAGLRQPNNYQSNGFVADVTSKNIRCDQMATASEVGSVAAGGNVGFLSNPAPYHPGPLQFYMAKVPEGQDVKNWDGAGSVWFKVYSRGAIFANKQMTWPNWPSVINFTVPKSTPSGDYLVRGEQIGLHAAGTSGGAQFYIACGQITVTGGGSGTPGPLVSFPGAYSASDPGILININYPVPTSYTPPGPAVWTG